MICCPAAVNHLTFTVVLRVGPGPVLLVRDRPVSTGIAGPTDVLHLPFLLHGLVDPRNIACKLWVRANCWVKG